MSVCASVCLALSQMGLLLDLSPDGGMNEEGNDEELEAELLKLMGGGGGGGRSQGRKSEGKGEKVIFSAVHSFPSCVSSTLSCVHFDIVQFGIDNCYLQADVAELIYSKTKSLKFLI